MRLRFLLAFFLVAAVAAVWSYRGHAAAPDSSTRTPVLVELFTSEGCSSCPPADALLIQLDQRQPIPGAEIIALGQHVDYWNYQGWSDRFSTHQITERQDEYSRRFSTEGPYTPQMVVDGRYQLVGNDGPAVQQTLVKAANAPKPATVHLDRTPDNNLRVNVENSGPGSPQVLLAITESGLSSSVRAGENSGRQLRHTAVVREFREIGKAKEGRFSATVPLKLKNDWAPQNLRAVVFVQERGLHEVLGAASLALR